MPAPRPALRYEVRAATPADRDAILELLAEHRSEEGVGVAEARYAWFYEQGPAGPALTWLAFGDGGRPLGITSIFPRRMWIGDREVRGTFGGDSYVRPEARRIGMGQALLRTYGEQLGELGFSVMYGLPQPGNRTPLAKLQTFDVDGGCHLYVRPLRTRGGALVDLFARMTRPRGRAVLEAMVDGDGRVDEVWDASKRHLGVAVVRDAAFYTWRFSRSVSNKQKPFVVVEGGRAIAACALERAGDTLYVADLLAAPSQLATALAAIADAAAGEDRIVMRYMPAYARRGLIWRAGFFSRGQKPLNILVPPGKDGAAAFLDGKRWFITWSDSDVDVTALA
jgi:GNAT superfamily N-acetyltransferase